MLKFSYLTLILLCLTDFSEHTGMDGDCYRIVFKTMANFRKVPQEH